MKRSLLPLFWLLFTCLGSANTTVLESINWPRFMARHDMVWERLPTRWTEAPHFGNAMLGSMFFQQKNELILQVFRADVQEHRDNSFGWTAYSRPRLTIGAFELKPVGKIQGGNLRTDLWNAELTGTITTDQGEIRLRHFVHAEDMAIVTEIWTTPGEAACQWSWQPAPAQSVRKGYPTNSAELAEYVKKYGEADAKKLKAPEPNPPGRLESKGTVNVWTQDLLYGGQYATAWTELDKGNGHRIHLATIANSYPEKIARKEALKTIGELGACDLASAEASHRDWWHRYYQQSFVTLPETRLETLYWNSIFRYGCTARTGRAFVDCPGIWFQGGQWPYITTDYNIQTALWGVYAANRLDIGGELMETLHRSRAALASNVRPVEWQNDSAYLSVATQPDMISPRDQDMRYWNLMGCLPWALHNCWWQYRYSMDDDMLREKFFPLLRRSVNFYLHLLREENGKLRLPPTYSPESGVFEDCNFDLSLLRWGCRTLLWSAARLHIDDPLIPKWKDVLERLVDFPADENGFRLGSNKPAEANHRHGSHLLMIYPLYLVNIDQPGTAEVLRESVERFSRTKHLPAMVATHSVPAATAIGDGNLALDGLHKQIANLFPNGMWFNPCCLESSLSAANGIQTMLIQSWGDTLRIFPAVPSAWPDVAFHNLRAEGAFLVSGVRKGGKTEWVRIKSLAGEPCRVKTDLPPPVRCSLTKDLLTPNASGAYELNLRKGEEAMLHSGTSMPETRITEVPEEPSLCRSFGLKAKKEQDKEQRNQNGSGVKNAVF